MPLEVGGVAGLVFGGAVRLPQGWSPSSGDIVAVEANKSANSNKNSNNDFENLDWRKN